MKIYYRNEWVQAEIGDRKLKELNIVIGQNAWIGQDAWIGQNAQIEQDARIGQNVVINTSVFNTHNKFKIIICNKLLWIGCEGHTPEHWLENYKEIAEENNVSEDDIKWYLDFYETKLKNLI